MNGPTPKLSGDLAVLRRILRQGWRYKWMLLLATVGTTCSAGLLASLIGLVTKFLSLLGQASTANGPDVVARVVDGMRVISYKMLALGPIAALGAYISWWAGQWVANRCMMDQRNRVLNHLTELDLSFHHELTRGDLLTRLTGDLDRMLQLQQTIYGKLLQKPVEGLAWVVVMFWVDWRMAAAIGLIMAVAMLMIAPVLRRTRSRSQHARVHLAENFSMLEQVTAGIRVIKAMGSGGREQVRYSGNNRGLFDANMRVARARAQSDALTYGGIFAIVAFGLLASAYLYKHQNIEPQNLLVFLGALARLINIMRDVQRGWGDAQEQIPAVERVFAVLDRPSRLVEKPGAVACPRPARAISVEGVHFRYQLTDEEVLRGLDIDIPVGTTVALVGESGAGKSTLLDLIPRFHDVTAGRICIDGVDIRDYRIDSLVAHIAIVQQDSFLFNDSVYNNISYGRPGASREEVYTAARRAHAHETILSLEGGKGYDTMVGDRGGRLSGGQRQRIAIARALLRDAPLLLLDEPTSALDADSERHVQEALQELMQGRTTVVVAHRLATIQRADVIYVLAGKDHPLRGTVLEHGSHRELIDRGGEYARLVRLQQLAV